MADGSRPAVFLDRDGTIVEDPGPGFLHEPAKVRLFPGAGEAIRRLREAGFLVVTVTNQSGIARGLYTAADYEAVQRRLVELLATHGARLDASYFCPHHPQFTGPCDCRKPGTKLFLDAQRELGIDLARSWWVGDRLSDVQPARLLGGGRPGSGGWGGGGGGGRGGAGAGRSWSLPATGICIRDRPGR
ncbi:MAG: D-glycero-alpha-D-manno-heptose-1,7-bisphosphate 7-phosphatase [Gemmatimonadales bacterium]